MPTGPVSVALEGVTARYAPGAEPGGRRPRPAAGTRAAGLRSSVRAARARRPSRICCSASSTPRKAESSSPDATRASTGWPTFAEPSASPGRRPTSSIRRSVRTCDSHALAPVIPNSSEVLRAGPSGRLGRLTPRRARTPWSARRARAVRRPAPAAHPGARPAGRRPGPRTRRADGPTRPPDGPLAHGRRARRRGGPEVLLITHRPEGLERMDEVLRLD